MADRERHLTHLVARTQTDPFFLGSALRAYAASLELDETSLADDLGCDTEDLVHIALCRRPAGDSPTFLRDVATIAARFGADPDALANVVRHADSLQAFQRYTVDERGLLMAARDKPLVHETHEDDETP